MKKWMFFRGLGRITERFPSGQREQTVNLPAQPSEVQILPSPPHNLPRSFTQLRHVTWRMK